MSDSCDFSIVTEKYLSSFRRILERMICGMTSARLTDSISHNFIVQMLPHHRAAIEMSRNLLCYTTFIPLQDIALGIIREQTKSIQDMERILCCCSRLRDTRQEVSRYQAHIHEITRTMFSEMENACTVNDINITFMHQMIPHHEGAIRMSKTALEFPVCSGLVPILEAIISSQEEGVCRMEKLLSEYCPC